MLPRLFSQSTTRFFADTASNGIRSFAAGAALMGVGAWRAVNEVELLKMRNEDLVNKITALELERRADRDLKQRHMAESDRRAAGLDKKMKELEDQIDGLQKRRWF